MPVVKFFAFKMLLHSSGGSLIFLGTQSLLHLWIEVAFPYFKIYTCNKKTQTKSTKVLCNVI